MTREEALNILARLSGGATRPNWDDIRDAAKVCCELISRPSLPEGLDEAADEYAKENCENYVDTEDGVTYIEEAVRNTFKAGAEWGANHKPYLPEGVEEASEEYSRNLDYYHYTGDDPAVAFKAGAEWMKAKMMKEAVEGYVNYYEDSGGILMAEAQVGCPYHNGDKGKNHHRKGGTEMKFKFIQNHSLTAFLKAILYIAIVSGTYFGINALARVSPTVTSYTLTMACCAIFLHFYDKEEQK